MQAWDLVKVIAEGEHHGRAGLVQAVSSDGTNEVKLDETETHQEGVENFTDDQLQLLGR